MKTQQEKIQEIRSKCIEANPDIKKLQFGCKFIWNKPDNGKAHPAVIIRVIENHPFLFHARVLEYDTYSFDRDYTKSECEIIGRDIGLSDILVAIGKLNGDIIRIDEFGQIWQRVLATDVYKFKCHWNLLKDSLDLQDEPTIDFIYNLLCNDSK